MMLLSLRDIFTWWGVVIALTGGLLFITGIGLTTRALWARTTGVVLAAYLLFLATLGSVLGIYYALQDSLAGFPVGFICVYWRTFVSMSCTAH